MSEFDVLDQGVASFKTPIPDELVLLTGLCYSLGYSRKEKKKLYVLVCFRAH